jgi:hypothetical protein
VSEFVSGRLSPVKSAGYFQAKLQVTDEILVKKSRQPFLDGAVMVIVMPSVPAEASFGAVIDLPAQAQAFFLTNRR